MRLVAGSMPDTSPASGIQVVVTAQTASAWGLRPGSRVAVIAPLQTTISGNGPPSPSFKLNLDVTGIVEPTDPDSSFWKADPLLAAPNLYVSQSKLWEGAFTADPGEITTMQEIHGLAGLSIRWEFPVATAGLRAQAPALYSEMKQFTLQTPQLTGAPSPDVQLAREVPLELQRSFRLGFSLLVLPLVFLLIRLDVGLMTPI